MKYTIEDRSIQFVRDKSGDLIIRVDKPSGVTSIIVPAGDVYAFIGRLARDFGRATFVGTFED